MRNTSNYQIDKIGNHQKFKNATKQAIEDAYKSFWTNSLTDPNLSRLSFYKKIKREFEMENYIDTVVFEYRRLIAKLRCSDHALKIEKGRHKSIPKPERTCTLCHTGQVEDEEHFLFFCNTYNFLRIKYNLVHFTGTQEFFSGLNYNALGNYLQ